MEAELDLIHSEAVIHCVGHIWTDAHMHTLASSAHSPFSFPPTLSYSLVHI
jgi:hypothetical protein